MLAPARLVLALLAVLAAVGQLVFHLVNVVEAARVVLIIHILLSGSGDDISMSEVVEVTILLGQQGLVLLDFSSDGGFCLACLFLSANKITKSIIIANL